MVNRKACALITGASAGIGAALSDVFARKGHDLVLVARRLDALEARARALESAHGVIVRSFAADLSGPGSASRLHDAVSSAGLQVDILVNNAGVGLYGDFRSTDLDTELRMIQLNVTSLVELTKRVLPGMVERRSGRIMNVASTAAFVPGPLMSIYYATKAFVLSFSEAIGFELRDSGISVTALCPGPTASEFGTRAHVEKSRLFQGSVMDAETVARVGYDGLMKGRPVVIPGLGNKLVPQSVRLAPRRVVTALSYRAAKQA